MKIKFPKMPKLPKASKRSKPFSVDKRTTTGKTLWWMSGRTQKKKK